MTSSKSTGALQRSAREPEAFAHFYEEHVESLLAYLARRVYDADVALDLAHETFAQAYLARQRFRGSTDAEAAAWLYGIARRLLARYFRRSAVELRALRRLGLQAPRLDDAEEARLRDVADLDQLRAALRPELERLSREQRDALRLRVVDELPYSAVALRLGISEQAARARVSRGLKVLARALDNHPVLKESLP
jgi:RNA polymerase sigma-70 factor (ECF subfamily)